jgi:hypothetical protein
VRQQIDDGIAYFSGAKEDQSCAHFSLPFPESALYKVYARRVSENREQSVVILYDFPTK